MIPSIENTQRLVYKRALFCSAIFFVLTIMPFLDNNFLSGIWAIAFVQFFLAISAFVVAMMYRLRANKLDSLLSGQHLLAQWTLTEEEKVKYADYLLVDKREKNKLLFVIMLVFIVLIFGLFILFMDDNEERLFMFIVMLALIAILGIAAFVMPYVLKNKNLKADGHILVGSKYAYINGYFHNWDFLLSGLDKAEVIHEPFYGLHLTYYYVVRSIRNTEELNIPAPANVNVSELVERLRREQM